MASVRVLATTAVASLSGLSPSFFSKSDGTEGVLGEAGQPGGGDGGGRLRVSAMVEAAGPGRGRGITVVLVGVGEDSGGGRVR
jgi:hypothetical protein